MIHLSSASSRHQRGNSFYPSGITCSNSCSGPSYPNIAWSTNTRAKSSLAALNNGFSCSHRARLELWEMSALINIRDYYTRVWLLISYTVTICHGLGIVDTNELNSYLTIVAIDENIESGEEEKRRRKSIYTKKSYMIVCGLATQLACLDCFHGIVCRVDGACW